MPLHPKIAQRIAYEADHYPDLTRISVDEGRRVVREMVAETDAMNGPAPNLVSVGDKLVPLPDRQIRVRVYNPSDSAAALSTLVYLHGGGWVFCDLDTHDSICREISYRSGRVVISVDYRRSPEHKFPDALEDCFAVLQWTARPEMARELRIDPTRIGVGGDSAGGNMSAVLAQLSRDRGRLRIESQVLLCPVIAHLPNNRSYRDNAEGTGLDPSFMNWMWQQYLARPEDSRDPRVVPLEELSLANLPRALVITTEYDILRDEGLEYAARLRDAGVDVRASCYPGMVHSFIDYRGIVPSGWQALGQVASFLRDSAAKQE